MLLLLPVISDISDPPTNTSRIYELKTKASSSISYIYLKFLYVVGCSCLFYICLPLTKQL